MLAPRWRTPAWRNKAVTSRYTSPSATRAPEPANLALISGKARSTRNTATLAATSTFTPHPVVKIGPRAAPLQRTVRTRPVSARPSATHVGQWWPTGATTMQSAQMLRPHLVQLTPVVRSGCL